MDKVSLFIDGANLREGGGITHIVEILNVIGSDEIKFDKVFVFANNRVLGQIKDRDWLVKRNHWLLEKGFFGILLWKWFHMRRLLKSFSGVLFSPAGNYVGTFHPVVNMSRNMLVFDDEERRRFPIGALRFKFAFTKFVQLRAFRNSDLVIYLSKYAESKITPLISSHNVRSTIINHGVNLKFRMEPKEQKAISAYTKEAPFKLLYVSPIIAYKHQWNVVKAVAKLRNEGFPIEMHFVGYHFRDALAQYNMALEEIPNHSSFIFYHGKIDYKEIHTFYKRSDGFIFASTCENMPNTLVEAMASGLPILSSNYGPMPEVLGDSPFYFDPINVGSIEAKLREFLLDHHLRELEARKSFHRSQYFSWHKCSSRTFQELYSLALK